jgi:hypothetical protein
MAKVLDKTVIKTVSLCGFLPGGCPALVDVKDGKIVRVRPLHYDSEYSREYMNPWKLKRNNSDMLAPMKSLPGPYSLAYKKRAYSPNRIKFPV